MSTVGVLEDKRACGLLSMGHGLVRQEEEDTGFGASLLRSRRSQYTPATRDTASASINDRSNLVFEGAWQLCWGQCLCVLRTCKAFKRHMA
jgi:hypothetical protein